MTAEEFQLEAALEKKILALSNEKKFAEKEKAEKPGKTLRRLSLDMREEFRRCLCIINTLKQTYTRLTIH